jgi:hypothetical protein
MQVELRPENRIAILTPEADDEPGGLEDAIHDQVVHHREERGVILGLVILDLSAVSNQQDWLRAVGLEVPDTNLRVALGLKGYAVARLLRLDAFYDWYPDVEAALHADD